MLRRMRDTSSVMHKKGVIADYIAPVTKRATRKESILEFKTTTSVHNISVEPLLKERIKERARRDLDKKSFESKHRKMIYF
jgi:hypothetical protein